jgi:diguanylate cyclase (GGDEF)-like protein
MSEEMHYGFSRLRQRLLQGLCFYLIAIAGSLSLVNVYLGDMKVAAAEALLAISSLAVYLRLKKQNLTFAQSLVIPVFFALVILYATWVKGAPERIYLWTLVVPPLFYFLFGKSYGFYSTLIVGVVQSIIIFERSSPDAFMAFRHNINFCLAYFSIWVVSHFYEINRKRSEDALKLFAVKDPLTNLHNRFSLKQSFDHLQAQDKPFTLVLIDLDNFKAINDNYGHEAGDQVLISFAELLKSEVGDAGAFHISRESVFRVGGEEFALLLFADVSTAQQVTERIRASVEASSIDYDGDEIRYTMSAGLHQCQPGETLSDVLKLSDIKLYQAKQAGRNTVHV